MSDNIVRLEERHTIIIGNSGKGKTTLLREAFDRYPHISIHLNHNSEGGFKGRRVEGSNNLGAEDTLEVFDSWEDIKIDLHPGANETANNALWAAIRFGQQAWEIAKVSTQITIDESHNLVPGNDGKVSDGDPNLMAWVLHEGRGHALKLTFATQEPRQLRPMYNNFSQLWAWVWVGPPSGQQNNWLNHDIASWLPTDKLRDLDRFEWLMVNDEGSVIDRGETDPDYGAV